MDDDMDRTHHRGSPTARLGALLATDKGTKNTPLHATQHVDLEAQDQELSP